MKKVLFLLMLVMMLGACQGQVSDNNNQVAWKEYSDQHLSFIYPNNAKVSSDSAGIKITLPGGYIQIDIIKNVESFERLKFNAFHFYEIDCKVGQDGKNLAPPQEITDLFPKNSTSQMLCYKESDSQNFLQLVDVFFLYSGTDTTYRINTYAHLPIEDMKDFIKDFSTIKQSLKVEQIS